jgi:hypothetical protein
LVKWKIRSELTEGNNRFRKHSTRKVPTRETEMKTRRMQRHGAKLRENKEVMM